MFGLKGVYCGIYKHFKNLDNRLRLLAFPLLTILLFSSSGIIQKSSSRATESCNCVVFRLSGVQDYFVNEAQVSIMDVFLKKNQSLALGLVMNQIGQDNAIINNLSEGINRGIFELAINGWNFTDYSILSEHVQANSLIKANEKLETLFEITSKIFIPPYERFNTSTLDAMRQANMTVLSSNIGTETNQFFPASSENDSDITNQTIYHLPATTSYGLYNATGTMLQVPLQQIQNDINLNIDKYGYVVINLDAQFFVDKTEETNQVPKLNNQEINNLSSLIDFLVSNNIDITTFSKITGINTNVPIIRNKATTLFTASPTNITSNKVVILAFDDGWESQYTIAKPILDKYGFKATFFIVCNYVGRDIDGERMDWKDIEALQNEGHDIQSHTMSHANLSEVSKGVLDFEVGQSKQCLLDHGINSTIFAYPQDEGSHNRTVVDTVAKHYTLARTGEEPLMYLNCDGWKGISSQIDCKTYFDNGTLTFVNRYSIPGWTHNSHSSSMYNSSQMFQEFVEVINSQANYNKNGVKAIPIITYHNITYQNIIGYGKGTLSIDKDLFESEMKYLHDNDFRVIRMADLGYNEYNNNLYIKHLRFNNEPEIPQINDSSLNAEAIVDDGLQLPTTMAFLGPNDILVLEKDKGTVRRIVNGSLLQEPLLDVNVATEIERCMCGIAVSKSDRGNVYVFLYFTEAGGSGSTGGSSDPVGNRLYRYQWINNQLVNPKLLLDLPAIPGPRHNGGVVTIGPDNYVYVIIGDVEGNKTKSQNLKNGTLPDGTSGILRITQDGQPLLHGPLGDTYPLNLYYAYGIRNSFGMDFDPVTGNLWDTENGPGYGDEVNLVKPGFNSGWEEVQGMWTHRDRIPIFEYPNNLVDFNGKGYYSSPEFIWNDTIGPTAIKFFNSDRLGTQYQNDMFVGDFHRGNLYHFDLSEARTDLILEEPLADKVADDDVENEGIIFGEGFGSISDIEVGLDGYLYVVSIGQGKIFRITHNSSTQQDLRNLHN